MGGLFLDIKGAFEHAHRETIAHELRLLGLASPVCALFQGFLKSGRYHTRYNNATSNKTTFPGGIRQGDVLSPLYWGLFFRRIFDECSEADKKLLYIDACFL